VRTIDEALDLAAEDLDTATALLDVRHLGGSARLAEDLGAAARGQWRHRADRVLPELVDLLGKEPDVRGAEGIGRLVAQLHTLRRMSISVNGMLAAGKEPVLQGSMVKDLGTQWEQKLPARVRELAAFAEPDPGNQADFEELLRYATLIAPKLTIQGGTTEILRGIIARGLGLR